VVSFTACYEQLPDPEVFALCLRDSFQEYLALVRPPARRKSRPVAAKAPRRKAAAAVAPKAPRRKVATRAAIH
jgi:hypothetical protein